MPHERAIGNRIIVPNKSIGATFFNLTGPTNTAAIVEFIGLHSTLERQSCTSTTIAIDNFFTIRSSRFFLNKTWIHLEKFRRA